MKIYNTKTRKKEEFVPIEPGKIKMYVCGPTVYNYFHIGNARPFLFFDVVRKYFEYKGYEVIYVQNITDIDDKIIEKANEEGVSFKQITKKYISAFYEDIEKLGIQRPTFQPKATEFIGEMIKFIKNLENDNFAYSKNGDVYFSVEKVDSYGSLSGRKLEDMKAGARIEQNPNKQNPFDFTLWKTSKPAEPQWNCPWGKGRPGWHTECVVMSRQLLGDKIDIHGGGNDLIFPHHENELAQAVVSGGDFVNYWMHNGFINIDGEKMSKSLNNFFTARDILEQYDSEAIRFFFLSKHYRSPIDFNEEIIIESQKAVDNFYNFFKKVGVDNSEFFNNDFGLKNSFVLDFESAMDDDFNTAKALAVFFSIVKAYDEKSVEHNYRLANTLYVLGQVLGFFQKFDEKVLNNVDGYSEELIEILIDLRNDLKKEKLYSLADKIRNRLENIDIVLEDTPGGTRWRKK